MPEYQLYIAAPLSEIHRARHVATLVRRHTKIEVVSTWHEQPAADKDPDDPSLCKEILATNTYDLLHASCLLALTKDGIGRETYIEIGRAIAWSRPVLWSRQKGGLCLSQYQSQVRCFDTDLDCVEFMASPLFRDFHSPPIFP